MDKIIRILAGLAIVQLVFVVIVNMGGNTLAGQAPNQPLLAFDKDQVDTLIIKGEKKTQVKLRKKEGQWQTEGGFPADQRKVESLVTKIHEMKHGLPVTNSDMAIKRFKVANERFERHIILQNGDRKLAALFVGSGAGARQSHVRSDDDITVYTGSLGTYDAPDTIGEWQDKNILQVDKKDISSIKLEDRLFQRAKNKNEKNDTAQWESANLPQGKHLNIKAINDGLSSLVDLTFNKVLGRESKPEYGIDKPVLTLNLTYKKGEREYLFGKLKDKDDYVLKVSDWPEYFQLTGSVAKPILDSANSWLTDNVKKESKSDGKNESTAGMVMDKSEAK
ncbi:MAG: hypothetical protein DSZ28_03370 [Thiothrix sp.]|nr:MAG: hypothetical protein DSZ28_03370 [Thiothrix sp.]